jgi:hypothetical protein
MDHGGLMASVVRDEPSLGSLKMTVAQGLLGGSPATGCSLRQSSQFLPLPIITDGQVWGAGATTFLHRIGPCCKVFLAQGLDEILTVNRLRLPPELHRSLACTNAIENVT